MDINRCKHLIVYYQSVPMPFGIGSTDEELWDCKIESESEECRKECINYEETKND